MGTKIVTPRSVAQATAALFLGCVILIVLPACSMSEQTDIAEAQVAQFHQRLSAGQFESIYDAASEEFKKSALRPDILRFLGAVHSKLGLVKESKRLNWNVNYHTAGTFVTLNYETQFDGGKATELFVFRIEKPEAKLVKYKIDSMAFVVQ